MRVIKYARRHTNHYLVRKTLQSIQSHVHLSGVYLDRYVEIELIRSVTHINVLTFILRWCNAVTELLVFRYDRQFVYIVLLCAQLDSLAGVAITKLGDTLCNNLPHSCMILSFQRVPQKSLTYLKNNKTEPFLTPRPGCNSLYRLYSLGTRPPHRGRLVEHAKWHCPCTILDH